MDNFIRKVKIEVEGLIIEDLRVSFEVEKSLVGSPNLAKIDIYNLNESQRNTLKDKDPSIKLFAGYKDNYPLIFKGQIRNINHLYVGVDWITTLYCGDGALALENATINKTFAPGTTQEQIFNELTSKLTGVAQGTLDGLKECITGKVSLLKSLIVSGSVKEWLDKLSKSCGFDYSVNDEVIETTQKGKPLNDEPSFIVSQKTGMIGSPEVTEIGANVSVYLKGSLKLGRTFTIVSPTEKINLGNQFFRKVNKTVANQTFRINQLKHTGDTHDNTWQTDIIGLSYGK